ncbi:hypothetical protein Tco_1470490, partial [Tanacetum coccineum]
TTAGLLRFWSTVMVKTINRETQLHALVDGKKIIITESSVRRDLQLADEEGSAIPTDPHHTPTFIQPSTQPQKIKQSRKPKRKDTQVPQSSDPIKNVTDEAVHKELGDSLVRAATTASSLEAEQDNDSNDSLLARGNTLRSDEDRLKLDELMALCTTLQNRVLDLEKTKTTQHNEIASLKRRVKKLEKKNRSRTHRLKRLYKGRIDAIEADEEITLVCVHDVNVSAGEEVFVAEQEVATNEKDDEVNVVEEVVEVINTAKLITDATTVSGATTTINDDGDITLAQALIEMKSTKPKVKGVVIQELGKSTLTISSQQSQDKGKGILIEPVEPMKRKDQIRRDEETALKLQAKFDEEERLAREKAKKVEEAN